MFTGQEQDFLNEQRPNKFESFQTNLGYINVTYDDLLSSNYMMMMIEKPVIVSIQQSGFNYKTDNILPFFYDNLKMLSILKNFYLIHIDLPPLKRLPRISQLNSASSTSSSFDSNYEEIVLIINQILKYFDVKYFLGFGVGAGANILLRYSIKFPDRLHGLLLINPSFNSINQTNNWWSNSVWFKFLSNMPKLKLPGRNNRRFIRKTISKMLPQLNNGAGDSFFDLYLNRTKLDKDRSTYNTNINCPIIIMSGGLSSNNSESEKLAKRLDPGIYELIQMPRNEFILEECPDIIANIFQLFVQGLGFIVHYPLDGI